jgi:uncharacterized protein
VKRWALGLTFCLYSLAAHATVPDAKGFVTDTVGLLPTTTQAALEQKLTWFQQTTTIEIAVLIVPTLDGAEPHDFADEVWKQWNIGAKGKDNGVLILVVPPPEKKAWIQTGYGIQGWLTDTACKHIVTDVMRPLNLQNKRVEAVVAGVDAVIAKLGSTPWVERAKLTPPKDTTQIPSWIIFVIIVAIFILLLLFFVSGGYLRGDFGGDSDGGGGFGGFGGGDSGGGGGGGDSG